MANFFIRRPIVAIVIAIITVLLGLNSLRGLSFEQYPFLAWRRWRRSPPPSGSS